MTQRESDAEAEKWAALWHETQEYRGPDFSMPMEAMDQLMDSEHLVFRKCRWQRKMDQGSANQTLMISLEV